MSTLYLPPRIIFTSQPVIQPPEGHLESWQPQDKNLSWVLANGIDYKLSLFITLLSFPELNFKKKWAVTSKVTAPKRAQTSEVTFPMSLMVLSSLLVPEAKRILNLKLFIEVLQIFFLSEKEWSVTTTTKACRLLRLSPVDLRAGNTLGTVVKIIYTESTLPVGQK